MFHCLLAWVIAGAFVVGTYLKAPDWQKQFNLPDEPKWRLWLVLAVLTACLLFGFYTPWPQF